MTKPNSSIVITPGTGETVATHIIDGKKYQVVIVAGSAGHLVDTLETWIAYANNVAFAGNKYFLSIMNGAGSGKVVKVHKLFLVNLAVVAVTGVMVRFDIMKATAHSAGTSITPEAFDTNNTALPAQVTVRTGATVTEGNLLFSHAISNDEVGATSAFPTPQILASLNLLFESPRMQEATLREGEGLTVKMVTSTTVGTYGVICIFTVE